MVKRLIPVTVVLLIALTACDTETSLEPTPEAVPGCDSLQPSDTASGEWGEAEGIPNEGVRVITVNEGYTVDICAGGGNRRYDGSFSGPGMLEVGSNFNGWSMIGFTGPTTTTEAATTTLADTTTTAAPGTTTSEATSTTVEVTTSTLAPGEVTSTTVVGVTTTEAAGVTTTEVGGVSTTAPGEVTTTETAGESTTSGAGEESTTTVEVGAGTLEPGQETSTTGDPGEETTTTGDDVAGGSESTLPYTGAGDMTMGGLAGLLVAAGIVILLLFGRRRPEED